MRGPWDLWRRGDGDRVFLVVCDGRLPRQIKGVVVLVGEVEVEVGLVRRGLLSIKVG